MIPLSVYRHNWIAILGVLSGFYKCFKKGVNFSKIFFFIVKKYLYTPHEYELENSTLFFQPQRVPSTYATLFWRIELNYNLIEVI